MYINNQIKLHIPEQFAIHKAEDESLTIRSSLITDISMYI